MGKKAARKAVRKAAKLAKLVEREIPLDEQSVDLAVGDNSAEGVAESSRARAELTKAMRVKRRASIKESNFLKTMR
jgi:large subunit ribosomal protein L54